MLSRFFSLCFIWLANVYLKRVVDFPGVYSLLFGDLDFLATIFAGLFVTECTLLSWDTSLDLDLFDW